MVNMPISKILPDGRVEVYNTKTGEVKQVTVQELRAISPNLVPQYEKFVQTQQIVNAGANVPADEVTRQVLASSIASGDVKPQLSADEQKKQDAKMNAARIIQQAEDLYYGKADTTSDDLAYGRIGGLLQSVSGKLGYNPSLTTYENFLESIRPTLARAAGDVGALSEQEQRAAIKILPKATSTKEEAARAFKEVRRKFGILDTPTKTSTGSKFKIEAIE